MNVDVCSEALIIRTVDGEIVLLSCEFACSDTVSHVVGKTRVVYGLT